MLESEVCSVYLFGFPDGTHGHVVKVGISNNVWSRLASIQSHNPHEVIPHFDFIFRSRNLARTVEARFHRRFAAYSLRGEWFCMGEHHALFMLTMEVVRVMSETYPQESVARFREECGLLRAFQLLDRRSDDEHEMWNAEWMAIEGEPV